MIARDLISESIYPAKWNDTVGQVIEQLEVYRLGELPVQNDEGDIVGIITMTQLTSNEEDTVIKDLVHVGLIEHVAPIAHIFDVIKLLGKKGWTMMPVLNKEGKYRGIISQEDIFKVFATSYSVREDGAIIVVETKRMAYSMSEIAQIVESENVSIVSCFISDGKDIDHIRVTIKLSKMDVQRVAATFDRYGYEVIASFTPIEHDDILKDRYDHLMSYLNV